LLVGFGLLLLSLQILLDGGEAQVVDGLTGFFQVELVVSTFGWQPATADLHHAIAHCVGAGQLMCAV